MIKKINIKEFEESPVVAVATFDDSVVSAFWKSFKEDFIIGNYLGSIDGNAICFEGQASAGCVCDGCTATTDGCHRETCNGCNARTMGNEERFYFPASASIVEV